MRSVMRFWSTPALGAALCVLIAGLSGCLYQDLVEDGIGDDDVDGVGTLGPFAVIAVIDTGINPYHVAFRDDSPRAFMHPSTYLTGYPEDAVAINITFDHPSVDAAVAADCRQWEKVEPGRLYWFPGTRIVGAYATPGDWEEIPHQDSSRGKIKCGDNDRAVWGNIYGSDFHGTLVTSRAAADGYGACPECLIVAVQGLGPHPVLWAADQPWIDLSNHSWAPQAPLYQPSGMPVPRMFADPDLVRAVEDASSRQSAFYGSGNGLLFRWGTLGHPTQAVPHMTPSALRVGGHDNGQVTLWHGSSPHIVADACGGLTADHFSLDEAGPHESGGTSLAAPYAAGIAGRILIEARIILGDHRVGVRDGVLAAGTPQATGPLSDGVFTKAQLELVLLATATTSPEAVDQDGRVCDPREDTLEYPTDLLLPTLPVDWGEVPDGEPKTALIGYGAVTPGSLAHAVRVLHGEEPLPQRPDEDAFFDQDRALRERLYGLYTMVP